MSSVFGMFCLKRGQAGPQGRQGRELKSGIIHVLLKDVFCIWYVLSKTWTSGTSGTPGTGIPV